MKYMKGQHYYQTGLDCVLGNYNIAPEKILSGKKSWRVIGDGLACNIHLLLHFNIFLFTQMPFYSSLCFPQSLLFHQQIGCHFHVAFIHVSASFICKMSGCINNLYIFLFSLYIPIWSCFEINVPWNNRIKTKLLNKEEIKWIRQTNWLKLSD